VTSWFEQHGRNIEAATVTTDGSTARDSFVVLGDVDAVGLAAHLSGGPASPSTVPSALLRVGVQAGLAAAGIAAGLAVRALRGGRPRQ
jgi:hypothetical protein